MEKVKIRNCESIIDGKAHAIELADGRKATAWCDKVDCDCLMRAYKGMDEIEVELKPWKTGKGLNIVRINTLYNEDTPPIVVYDAKATSDHHNPNAEGVMPTGKASANGQYQKPVVMTQEVDKELNKILTDMPKPEEYGEEDITSINAKSSVKIKKNSKGIGWEIKIVKGDTSVEIANLGVTAIEEHRKMCKEFPVEE